jgi:N-acetylneuraminic acid mutarotase
MACHDPYRQRILLNPIVRAKTLELKECWPRLRKAGYMRNEKNARTLFLLFGIWLWFVMLSIAIAQTGVALASSNKGTWMTAAPTPTKRTEVVAAAVKGQIYVVGGFSEPSLGNLLNFAISAVVEVYDPTTDTWSTKASLPIGLHHAGAAVVDDKLYVIGGFTKAMLPVWHPLGTVYAYDPSKDSWAELAPLPTARGALAVAELGGKLYAISGYNGEKNPEVVEVYSGGQHYLWRAVDQGGKVSYA